MSKMGEMNTSKSKTLLFVPLYGLARQIRDHSSITSSKRGVGGVRKWQLLMIYSTVNHERGGPKKAKNVMT